MSVEHVLRLSPEEVLGLRKAVNMVNRGAALYGDTDPHFLALLDVLEDKLDVDLALCRHCHGAPRRSRDGLCARCAQYRRQRETAFGLDFFVGLPGFAPLASFASSSAAST